MTMLIYFKSHNYRYVEPSVNSRQLSGKLKMIFASIPSLRLSLFVSSINNPLQAKS